MSPIKIPVVIVVRGGNDLSIHASIEEAESHLEAIDVTNNEFIVYDSEGRMLTLDVVRDKVPILCGIFKVKVERVRIREAEEEPTHLDELRSALIRFLAESDSLDNSPEAENTAKLIERVMKGC